MKKITYEVIGDVGEFQLCRSFDGMGAFYSLSSDGVVKSAWCRSIKMLARMKNLCRKDFRVVERCLDGKALQDLANLS